MKGNRIITIGRQIGSGGSEIGMEVAKRLGIRCYDKQLIELACNYGELDQDVLAAAEEKRPNPFLYSVPRQMQNDKTGRGIAINDMVFNVQSEVIRQLAEKESCVIIGRCASSILSDRKNALSVFLYANEADCVARIAQRNGLTERKARERMERINRMRRHYFNFYSMTEWGKPESYDAMLCTSALGIEGCADMIVAMLKKKLEAKTHE